MWVQEYLSCVFRAAGQYSCHVCVWVICPMYVGQRADTLAVYMGCMWAGRPGWHPSKGSGLCSFPNLYSALYRWKLVRGILQAVNSNFKIYLVINTTFTVMHQLLWEQIPFLIPTCY